MALSKALKDGLSNALNEATLLGTEIDTERDIASVTFSVLILPTVGPPPDDRRMQFLFYFVGRVAASLRLGAWDDKNAEVEPFDIGRLPSVVRSFKQPVSGWEFFDLDEDFLQWKDRLSLNYCSDKGSMTQSITLSQAGPNRHLDLRIWFDTLGLWDASGEFVEIDDFIAGGARWWDGLYSGDPRTAGEGITVYEDGAAGAYMRDTREMRPIHKDTPLPLHLRQKG